MDFNSVQANCFPQFFSSVFRRHGRSDSRACRSHKSSSLVSESKYGHTGERDAILPKYSEVGIHGTNSVITNWLSPEIMNTVNNSLDELDQSLREISLKIHGHPEVAFDEHYAHELLTAFMEKHGFEVTRSYAGLETAWRAEYTSGHGGAVIGINSEMDALPGIGHACGHNLIAISGIGVAVAVKTVLEDHGVPGKVVILGTPAEEERGGKILLLERGAYDNMDVCLMCHPTGGEPNSVSDFTCTATHEVQVEYFGKSAHAAAAPWEGKNALDAAVLAYSSISALRQQLKPDHRIHGIIEGRDWAPNVIPDYSKLRYIIRAPTLEDLVETVARVKGSFDAAALATGCSVNIKMTQGYYDVRQNSVLGREFSEEVHNLFGMVTRSYSIGASTDFGNVSYKLPAYHAAYAIPTEPDGGNHTRAFAKAAATPVAHQITMRVMKGLALVGLRVLYDPFFFEQVQRAFRTDERYPRMLHSKESA